MQAAAAQAGELRRRIPGHSYGPFHAGRGGHDPAFRAIHGKLFFTLSGGNYVCSGSVIGRSTVATAGHCISDGAGTFATNFMFCPSWSQTGEFPGRGCWSWAQASTSSNWHTGGDPDYDYACIVTATVSNQVANKIGNITGWAGRASFDGDDGNHLYPQAAPFLSNTIQQTARNGTAGIRLRTPGVEGH
jgi:hypothetical protein